MLRGILVLAGLAGGTLALVRRRRSQRDSGGPGAVAPAEHARALPAPAPSQDEAPQFAAREPGPPAAEPAPESPPPAGAGRTAPGGRSREELYREAREIGLKGRSRMTKAELEAALREHGR